LLLTADSPLAPDFIAGDIAESAALASATVPVVQSIAREFESLTSGVGTSLLYRVNFSEAVTGVDLADFQIITSGAVDGTAAPAVLVGSGSEYTVILSGVRGSGSLQLHLIDDDSIINGDGIALGGAGLGNGDFAGQAYSLIAQNSDLTWDGTSKNDEVRFDQIDATTVRVTETRLYDVAINRVYDVAITGQVRAQGLDGDDHLDARGLTNKKADLAGDYTFAGTGNDTLYGSPAGGKLIGGLGDDVIIATGNGSNLIIGDLESANGGEGAMKGGNNLIVGGHGSDTIRGGFGSNGGEGAQTCGRNLVIGNGGDDWISALGANGGEGGLGTSKGSILVGGTTTLSEAELTAVFSEWTSSRDYDTRVANISGIGVGPRNNGNAFLQAGVTVFNDNAVDQLRGNLNFEYEWYLYSVAMAQDALIDTRPGETKTLV
jgi:hypothetical protein